MTITEHQGQPVWKCDTCGARFKDRDILSATGHGPYHLDPSQYDEVLTMFEPPPPIHLGLKRCGPTKIVGCDSRDCLECSGK